ncbi:uncharacterized protein LOC114377291 [Glycine soja]|uniref:Uncharacterized protein n=1 Tax=Glycine soja TaxID=3848 RepID=A0A445I507_GLYSO|nr:uncharacterized protein LOC114377291 [Glycine soja]RZB81083.1 hypothetical protein D0Y65_030718 [Glycine soja]RZB81084.1 hypothetical protein D0Y65_030718 [Glycine soja]RZB81085.1 hypothetical protein D0Y65_030718 [Glycine soja]
MAMLRRYVTASAIALFALLLLLVTCNLNMALASSGGVMGGNFFDSDSESSSSESYTRDSESYRMEHHPHRYYDAPSPDTDAAKGSHSGLVLFLIFASGMFLVAFYKGSNGNSVTVIKLQVAMLGGGMGSPILRDLTRIAETADTSSRDGLTYLLADTIQSLVRHLRYCIAGYTFMNLKRSKEDGEKYYNQLSNEERDKFDEETLVNLNNTEKRSKKTQSDVFSNEYSMFDQKGIKEGTKKIEEEKLLNEFGDEYIVITILVAAKGAHKLPNINGTEDLKEALQKLRTVLSSKLLAGKVLWTPQNEDDTLSKRRLLEDYPQLAKGMANFLVKKRE